MSALHAHHAAGRTLVELVVAMALALAILAGVATTFHASAQAARTAHQVAIVEQSGQLALALIGDLVTVAGYGEIVGSDFVDRGQTLMDGSALRGCTGRRFVRPFPAYVAPPGVPLPPDLACTGTAQGDALYLRFQAGPAAAAMPPSEAASVTLRDCLGQSANQPEVLATPGRPGTGRVRPMSASVVQYDRANRTLDCRGSGGTTFQAIARDVADFRVYYRFDDAGYAAAAAGTGRPTPAGGSIRDAAGLDALAGPVDPWEHVVAVIVCLTVETAEIGIGRAGAAGTRCPADAGEAESGVLPSVVAGDGRVRRTFTQVYTVRVRGAASPVAAR